MPTERNTRIRASQIASILPNDVESTNELGTAMDGYIPSYDYVTGKFTWVENSGVGSHDRQHSIVSEADHSDKADYIDIPYSPTILTGGLLSSGTNVGTLKVSALTALIRTTDSSTGVLTKITLTEQDNKTLASVNVIYYVVLDYNSENPQITIQEAESNNNNQIQIGRCIKETDNTVHHRESGLRFQYGIQKMNERARQLREWEIGSGILIADESSKKFSISAGHFYRGINEFHWNGFDTSVSTPDTFTYVYYNYDTSSWVYNDSQTDIDVDNYNLITSGTGLTVSNKYKCDWVFVCPDDGHVFVVYGQDNDTLGKISDSVVPSLPDVIDRFGALIGRIIIDAGVATFKRIEMIQTTSFNPQVVIDHNDNSNKQGGQADEYYHLTSADYIELNQWLDNVTLGSDGKLTLVSGVAINEFSSDGTLDGNSDLAVPTEKAVKTYADTRDNYLLDNIALNAFRIAINGSLSQFNMIDGVVDEYEDETGIDTGASSNQDYDSDNNLYKPTFSEEIEIDYMEYASDGAAQSAYVTDTPLKKIVTAHGNAQVDTSEKVFGTGSVLFDGTDDYLTVPSDSDLAMNTGNFAWDFRVRFNSLVSVQSFISMGEVKLIWITNNTLSFYPTGKTFAWEPSTGIWYHIAVTRNGTDLRVFVDGNQVGNTETDGVDITQAELQVGTNKDYAQKVNGRMDEIRISKGTPRWTENFVKPTEEYTTDEYTKLLLHCNGDDESTIFIDDSAPASTLQSYSEDEINTQGSYSLKGIALITDSLNETLTKSSLSIDLSDVDTLTFDIYSSRTGENIKIGIHDSGGTTTEVTPDILSAGEWQEVEIDLSGVSNVNKDDIDSIIVTIVNADAENTFYIDNFKSIAETFNMTLISNDTEAEAESTEARLVILEEDVDEITINTDLKAYVSLDDGGNWEQVTLLDEGDFDTSKRILVGSEELTDRSDKTMIYKIETLNNKNCKIHATFMAWR